MPWDAACTRFSSTFLTTSHNDRAKGLILRQCISTSHFICAELEDVRAALEKERVVIRRESANRHFQQKNAEQEQGRLGRSAGLQTQGWAGVNHAHELARLSLLVCRRHQTMRHGVNFRAQGLTSGDLISTAIH